MTMTRKTICTFFSNDEKNTKYNTLRSEKKESCSGTLPDDLREQPTDYLGNTYTKKLRCNLPCLFLSNHQFARLEFKLLLSQRLVGSYMFSWGGPTLLFEFLSQNLRSWPVTFKLEWFESRKHILYPKMCFLVELFFLLTFTWSGPIPDT